MAKTWTKFSKSSIPSVAPEYSVRMIRTLRNRWIELLQWRPHHNLDHQNRGRHVQIRLVETTPAIAEIDPQRLAVLKLSQCEHLRGATKAPTVRFRAKDTAENLSQFCPSRDRMLRVSKRSVAPHQTCRQIEWAWLIAFVCFCACVWCNECWTEKQTSTVVRMHGVPAVRLLSCAGISCSLSKECQLRAGWANCWLFVGADSEQFTEQLLRGINACSYDWKVKSNRLWPCNVYESSPNPCAPTSLKRIFESRSALSRTCDCGTANGRGNVKIHFKNERCAALCKV